MKGSEVPCQFLSLGEYCTHSLERRGRSCREIVEDKCHVCRMCISFGVSLSDCDNCEFNVWLDSRRKP